MYYLINESLTPCRAGEIRKGGLQYAVVLTTEEWAQERDSFDMLIDMEMDAPQETKAVVNRDSLTGTLSIPNRENIRMNFRYMPELEWKYSYPVVIVISVLIVIGCLMWFKKKKWM